MLSYEELLAQVKQLPSQNKLALLEEVAHSLQEELRSLKNVDNEISSKVQGGPSSDRLYGILKSPGPSLTDSEIQEGYTDYLSEKYA